MMRVRLAGALLLLATTLHAATVTVDWPDDPNPPDKLTAHEVQQSLDSGVTWATVARVPMPTAQWQRTLQETEGGELCYRVAAVAEEVVGPWSAPTCVVLLQAPGTIRVRVTFEGVAQ